MRDDGIDGLHDRKRFELSKLIETRAWAESESDGLGLGANKSTDRHKNLFSKRLGIELEYKCRLLEEATIML
jgi:hypothetical protein